MTEKKKLNLYKSIFIGSAIVFLLEVFLLQKPNGVFGLLISLTSAYTLIGSTIKLCGMNPMFKKTLIESIDLLFWLP